jgi:hypothetical protein
METAGLLEELFMRVVLLTPFGPDDMLSSRSAVNEPPISERLEHALR